MRSEYDAILIVSFGGPEGPDDVLPFLENVLRGKNVPEKRKLEVAEHYQRFGGVSPINDQTRCLITSLLTHLDNNGPKLPVYWGNRNWYPMLADTIRQMADDGVRKSLAFFTSPYSSYSSCRQYLENIAEAREKVGANAPVIDRLRVFYNHPLFIEAVADTVAKDIARAEFDPDKVKLLFTAHSLPQAMADGCRYESQLNSAARLVAERLSITDWNLAFQSRSGPPHQPWLGPDVCEYLKAEHSRIGTGPLVIVPIGFISDHMEVIFDLDIEALNLAQQLQIKMSRASTVGTHPKFIEMIGGLIQERISDSPDPQTMGEDGPGHDFCPADCCPSGRPSSR